MSEQDRLIADMRRAWVSEMARRLAAGRDPLTNRRLHKHELEEVRGQNRKLACWQTGDGEET